jgi:glutathione peroxidase
LTPQYAGLRTLHNDSAERGFAVLAFPCNQFAGQEPGTDAEILDFATSKYQVTFPMFSKIDVNGDSACDLYRWLRSEQPVEDGTTDIRWNFEKFLVDRSGTVVARFHPKVTPEDIAPQLEQYLTL